MEINTFCVGIVQRTEDIGGGFHLLCRGENSGLVMSWYFMVKDTRLHSATKQAVSLVYRVCAASNFTQCHIECALPVILHSATTCLS